jgi:hypothetical protein
MSQNVISVAGPPAAAVAEACPGAVDAVAADELPAGDAHAVATNNAALTTANRRLSVW